MPRAAGNGQPGTKSGGLTVLAVEQGQPERQRGEVVCVVGESAAGARRRPARWPSGCWWPMGGEGYRQGHLVHVTRRVPQVLPGRPDYPPGPYFVAQPDADHRGHPGRAADVSASATGWMRAPAAEILRTVDLTPPDDFRDKYPHQLASAPARASVALTVHPSFHHGGRGRVHAAGCVHPGQPVEDAAASGAKWDDQPVHHARPGRGPFLRLGWPDRRDALGRGSIGPTPWLDARPQHPYTRRCYLPSRGRSAGQGRNKERGPAAQHGCRGTPPPGCSFHPLPAVRAGPVRRRSAEAADIGHATEVAGHVVAVEYATVRRSKLVEGHVTFNLRTFNLRGRNVA